MALQDLSEFTESLKSIDRMKNQLHEFNNKLEDLNEKFNSTSAVFSNVAKVRLFKIACKHAFTLTLDNGKFVNYLSKTINIYNSCSVW